MSDTFRITGTTTAFLRPNAPAVGYYVLMVDDGITTRYQLTHKPSAWHRFWMRFFFGFQWRTL